jgi:hypothetical protein
MAVIFLVAASGDKVHLALKEWALESFWELCWGHSPAEI